MARTLTIWNPSVIAASVAQDRLYLVSASAVLVHFRDPLWRGLGWPPYPGAASLLSGRDPGVVHVRGEERPSSSFRCRF